MDSTTAIATSGPATEIDRYLVPKPPKAPPTAELVSATLRSLRASLRERSAEAQRDRDEHLVDVNADGERGACAARIAHLKEGLDRIRVTVPRLGLTPEQLVASSALVDHARAILTTVTTNPDWVRATARLEPTAPADARQLLQERPELQEAAKRASACQAAVTDSFEAFRQFEAQPKWLASTREALFGERTRLAHAMGAAVQARTNAETEKRAVAERLLPECAAEARLANERAQETRRRAEAAQERLEAPLRAALVSVAVAAELLHEGRATASLADARPGTSLEFCGIHDRRGLAVAAFRGPDGEHYLADARSMRPELERLALTPGDRVSASPEGLRLEARGPHLHARAALVAGRIEDLSWQGTKLTAVTLRTDEGVKLLVPARGDDLQKELPPHFVSAHVARGAELKLAHGQLQDITAPTRARGRS
jgi:hypothetical protein